MLTRKHFEFFAKWLAECTASESKVNELCVFFKQSNRSFDKERFLNKYEEHKQEVRFRNWD